MLTVNIHVSFTYKDPEVWEMQQLSFAKTKSNILFLSFCFHKYCVVVVVLTIKEYYPENNCQLGALLLYDNNSGLYISYLSEHYC